MFLVDSTAILMVWTIKLCTKTSTTMLAKTAARDVKLPRRRHDAAWLRSMRELGGDA